MKVCSLYLLGNQDYVCIRMVKSASGFWVSSTPIIRFSIKDTKIEQVIENIKYCLNHENDYVYSDPINWTEHNKRIAEEAKLKSINDLQRKGNILCGIELNEEMISFLPYRIEPNPSHGYAPLNDKVVTISAHESNTILGNYLKATIDRSKIP